MVECRRWPRRATRARRTTRCLNIARPRDLGMQRGEAASANGRRPLQLSPTLRSPATHPLLERVIVWNGQRLKGDTGHFTPFGIVAAALEALSKSGQGGCWAAGLLSQGPARSLR